jgi:hypothetical protein
MEKQVGVKVTLKNPDDFLKIKETLTRIGISSRKEKKLFQSCHILHKRGDYFIVHFLEMFILDGKESSFTEEDTKRRNCIVWLLKEWELLSIDDEAQAEPRCSVSQIKIVPHKEKSTWQLVSKYSIGTKNK